MREIEPSRWRLFQDPSRLKCSKMMKGKLMRYGVITEADTCREFVTMTSPALMPIEVPTPSLVTQQGFGHLQAEVAALKIKRTAVREASAALLPATLERVFAESQ